MIDSSSDAEVRGTHRSRVEWMDTDAAGIYHNSTVIRFVEAAEATLMRERGLDNYFPVAPRVRFEVTFSARAALRPGDDHRRDAEPDRQCLYDILV